LADTIAEIEVNLTDNITENSVLCRDCSWSYVTIAKQTNCDHKRLINGKVRVIDKVYHIQTVNGKMKGIATEYLSNYLAWFRESNAKLNKQEILVAAYG
jgi:hypothetical protein